MRFLLGPTAWCLYAAICFGAATPICKHLLDSMHPVALAGALYLGAGVFTSPSMIKMPSRKQFAGDRYRVLGAVILGGGCGPVLLLWGLHFGSAGSTALMLNLETVFTVVLGALFFGEYVGKRLIFASLLVVMAGVVLLIPVRVESLLSGALIALACLCWAMDNHLTATIENLTPGQTTCIKGVLAGGVNLCIAAVIGAETFSSSFLLALFVGAVTYGVSIVLYVASAQQIGASRAQLVFASAPYWGLGLAWLSLGEHTTPQQIIGAFLMVAAFVVMNRESHAHEHTHGSTLHTHWHRHDDLHHAHEHGVTTRLFMGWHSHPHQHVEQRHSHAHRSDIHHRHH